jgi:chromosome segregation ATPase
LIKLTKIAEALAARANLHRTEITILRGEIDSLENVLSLRTMGVSNSLVAEISKVEGNIKRHFANQTKESNRLHQQFTQLTQDKAALEQQAAELQRRMAELELQVGKKDA